MTGDFDATKYRRTRVNIKEGATKENKGRIIREITVELGNQDKIVLIKDKNDVANIDEKEIQEYIFDLWDKITDEGHKRNKQFIDEGND